MGSGDSAEPLDVAAGRTVDRAVALDGMSFAGPSDLVQPAIRAAASTIPILVVFICRCSRRIRHHNRPTNATRAAVDELWTL